jgi:hypothetical protein
MDWHGWIWVRPTIEDNQQCQFWSGKWWSTNINWILSGYPIDTSSLFSDTLRLSCLLFVAKKNRQMAGHPLRIWSPKFFDGLSLGASGISSQDICSHTREYLYNAYVCMYIYMYIHVTQLMVSTHSHHSPIVLPPQKLMSLPGRRFRNRRNPRIQWIKWIKSKRGLSFTQPWRICTMCMDIPICSIYILYIYITVICIINII